MQHVETRFHRFEEPFFPQRGGELRQVELAYETYGALNEDRSNAVLVFHAITGSQHAAGWNEGPEGVDLWTEDLHRGWWDGFIGSGRAFDTDEFFVICVNYLGGCYGSTGPASSPPHGPMPYGSAFPELTLTDIVDSQARFLTELGIERLHGVAGGSVGGMMASVFAARYPERVDVVIAIASGIEVSSLQMLHNFEQMMAIVNDRTFLGGDYYPGRGPARGLALARMIGHKTFVSLESLQDRATHEIVQREDIGGYRIANPLESYVLHHAQKFVQRFDANTYLGIMRLWQRFDLLEEIGVGDVGAAFAGCGHQRWVVFTIDSDVCFYPSEQTRMVQVLQDAGVPTRRFTVHSDKGHDSFLTEPHLYEALIREVLSGWTDRTVLDPGSL